MIARAITRAINQLGEPAFRKVLIVSVLLALVVFVALFFGIDWVLPEEVNISDWDWLNDALSGIMGYAAFPLLFLVAWFFFPAVVTIFMGLFLDSIVDAVEDRYYPDRKAMRSSGLAESASAAARLGGMMILLNLLALPLYLLLVFTAVGPLILYLVINGYLLGREYFELVSMRHFLPADARKLRKSCRDRAFMAGVVIAVLFMVPFVNLVAPLLGAAMMVHVFHESIAAGARA